MAEQKIDVMVEGGKASAAPPLGPALGPLGVNIKMVVDEINKKTASFNGMQVPVTVLVNSESKTFTITVGTPPASALIKKESRAAKGAGNPKTEKVGNLSLDQVIKISKMKEDVLLGKTLKDRVKEVAGTCRSMGITIEGKSVADFTAEVNSGVFDSNLK